MRLAKKPLKDVLEKAFVKQGMSSHLAHTLVESLWRDPVPRSELLSKFSLVDGRVMVDADLYSTGSLGAYGLGDESGGGGGSDYHMLLEWADYEASKAEWVVKAELLHALYTGKADKSHNHDGVYLKSFTETDPTVPAWAKAASKPSYTAAEVGASPSGHNHDGVYLKSFTETDPTVPSWAKAASKPTYTAAEVGASPAGHDHDSITGNAATASKLKDAVSVWGQSFDGSGDVSGALTGVTEMTATTRVNTPELKIGNWTVKMVSGELQFFENDVLKAALHSGGFYATESLGAYNVE